MSTLALQDSAPVRPLGEAAGVLRVVEDLCPAPRYCELFSRRYRHSERWDVHGDEVERGQPIAEAAE
jgi:hypothetical protein